jgi:hypothetical protein
MDAFVEIERPDGWVAPFLPHHDVHCAFNASAASTWFARVAKLAEPLVMTKKRREEQVCVVSTSVVGGRSQDLSLIFAPALPSRC